MTAEGNGFALDPPKETKLLSIWLTREEWLSCWAYTWVAEHMDCFGFEGMDPAERRESFENLRSALVYGARGLWEAGYRFQGIDFTRDGLMRITVPEAVCYENVRMVVKIVYGGIPHRISALGTLLKELERQGVHGIDKNPILELYHAEVAEAKAAEIEFHEDPEVVEWIRRHQLEAIRSVGFDAVPAPRREDLN